MNLGNKLRKLLYKQLSFEQYLKVLSCLYFFAYYTRLLKNHPPSQYPYFIKKIVKKNDVVIDIGANMGYYTCLFARWIGKSGKVYAVEPVEPVRNVLINNTKKYSQVTVVPFALGKENKPIQMGNNTLKKKGFVASGSHFVIDIANNSEAVENPEIVFQVEMKKGSELFANLKKLDIIKCDVEGYEMVIIPEIIDIITKFYPTIIIETGSDNRLKITKLLFEIGYLAFVVESRKLRTLLPDDTMDILFIHKENALMINRDIFLT
ncbi:MAG: FkbM family methyltransferase [Bacteroidales bacterium]|jgi:FkbM family methyltransferase|nr:FkbM family methyltransferase [Bacteroidales bacterium]